MFLSTVVWTLYDALVFGNYFEDLKKLSTYELNLTEEVFIVSKNWLLRRSVLFLIEALLLLNKLQPRSHVAELLEHFGVHIFISYALAVVPATDDSFG